MHDLDYQLRELQLIRCSLMPGEVFSFVPSVRRYDETGLPTADTPPCSARISIRAPGSPVWFEVRVPEGPILRCSDVCVRGENSFSFPVYELLSLHLLPELHEHNQTLALPTLVKAWSSELHIAGFARIGYPGLIYAEGGRENVEEFVRNVKGMNWLALRVRFVEQVEPESGQAASVQKISDVLELMRKRGRESYITQHGIGSGSK
ncbi:hypothetical protein BKA82DRAFT_4099196 [Pisolithus tinctorius]|nr:hypothetical protein BKA82DRAFT_4099196 [Pisolithus tinctorius]